MYILSAILPSSSDERVLLRLSPTDGGEDTTLAVKVSELARCSLKKGTEISEELYGELCRGAETDGAIRKGLSILGYGINSAARLEEKLRHHGYSQSVARAAVAELEEKGYIDERSDALRLCDSMISKKYGRRKILMALRSRGYKGDALRVADDFLSDTDFSLVCESFLRAKVKKLPDSPAEMKKLLAKLTALGYNVSEVKAALQRIASQGQR